MARFLTGIVTYWSLILIGSVPACVHANEEFTYPSFVTIGVGLDSENSQDYTIDIESNLTAGARMRFSTGYSQFDINNRQDHSNSYLVGLFSDPGDWLNLGLEYEYVDEASSYTIDTTRLTIGVDVAGWSLDFIPEKRFIDANVNFKLPNITISHLSVQGTGLGGELAYSGFSDWLFQLAYHKYDYESNGLLTQILNYLQTNNTRRYYNLVARRRFISSGLEEKRLTLSTNYFFNWGDVGIQWDRSEAINSNDISNVYTLTGSKDLTASITMELELGQLTVSDDNDNLNFGALYLTYYW